MAYGLENEYLDAALPGVLAPGVKFAALADDHARQVDDVLARTAGIPDYLNSANNETAPALDGLELLAFTQQQQTPVYDASLANLRAQDLGLAFPPGDAQLDTAGLHLGVLQQSQQPTGDLPTGPDIPTDPPPDVPNPGNAPPDVG